MGVGHTISQVDGGGSQFVAFKLTNTGAGGTVTVGSVSPPIALAADISVVDSGVGIYTISIANFKGQQGVCIPMAITLMTGTVTASFAVVSAPSYSGETVSFTIRCYTSSTLFDSEVLCQVFAY